MDIKESFRDNGIIGILSIPICWFIGHDFNVGQRCIRCCEKRLRGEK